jgi:hypothetical protein
MRRLQDTMVGKSDARKELLISKMVVRDHEKEKSWLEKRMEQRKRNGFVKDCVT